MAKPPVILLAFARPDINSAAYLRSLPEEARALRRLLDAAAQKGRCELVPPVMDAVLNDVLDAFQNEHRHGRIAVFHFGGHAGAYSLLLEDEQHQPIWAGAGGLAAFLAEQPGLRLVFLNGCSTQAQVEALHAAGVPVVIATTEEIPDAWAAPFAERFYTGLAQGQSIGSAFNAALAQARMEYPECAEWPWRIYPETGEALAWALPEPTALPPQPLHKPLRAQHFTGRAEDLAALLADLQPGNAVLLCAGGGMGKSALAAEVVHTLAPGHEPPSLFPDGIFLHQFYREPRALTILENLARAYGVDPRPDAAAAARAAVRGKRLLLVLDGAERCDDLTAVLSLREVASECGVLITSRKHHNGVSHPHDLRPLPEDESVVMLRAWAKEYAGDNDAAAQLVKRLGRLPLALLLAGSYMANRRQYAAEYTAWLEEEGLAALDFGQHQQESIPILMRRSLEAVSEPARQAYAVAGVLAFAPFGAEPIATALDIAPAKAGRLLGELVDYGLLLRQGTAYQVTHALAHTYAHTQMQVPPEALAHLAAWYIAFAKQQTARGVPGFAELDQQLGHILAVQAGCMEAQQWDAVRRIAWETQEYLDLHGRWSERLVVLGNALAAAKQAGHRYDEGAFATFLGNSYAALGEVRRAIEYYEQALVIARAEQYRNSEGVYLGNLGNAYFSLGEVRRAIEYHEQALVIAREIGDREGEGTMLGSLGVAYKNLGEVHRAIEYYEQHLAIAREIGDRRGEGTALGNLGIAYRNLGEVRRAIDYNEQALVIAREIGDRQGEGQALGNLGLAYRNLGEVRRAIEYYEQRLAIAREIGERRGEGRVLGNLGLAYADLGEVRRAIEYYKQALAIAREIGDRRGEGVTLGNLGIAYRNLGEVRRAIEYHEQALATAREIGYRLGEANALGNLGVAYHSLSEVRRAIEYDEQQLTIAREIGDRRGEGTALGNLGVAYKNLGELGRAIKYHEQALAIARKIGDRQGEANATWNLGELHEEQGDLLCAVDLMDVCVVYEQEIGRPDAAKHAEHLSALRARLAAEE